jgi:acetyltransferase-like isoleucine patch superfamily enzyme
MGLIGSAIERVRLKLLKRDQYESRPLRDWFARDFGVEVGLYSYGCFDRWRFPARTRIGRYCSFADTARVLDANHPFTSLSTHPYLYERRFGIVDQDLIDPEWLVIEDDVWMSHGAIVTPGCKHIGRGAIIGAGAVVTKNVPAYAIVAGVPASLVRYRFDADTQAAIEASRWWELDRTQLAEVGRRDPQALVAPTAERLKDLAARR